MSQKYVLRGDFSRIWNDSVTLDEVANRTGYTRAYCGQLGKRLRSEGYSLQRLRRNKRTKWKGRNSLKSGGHPPV